MTIESNTGLGVLAHYGPRGVEDGLLSGGKVQAVGTEFEAVVYITGDDFGGTAGFNTLLTIPAGSFLTDATLEVEEVFTVGNADNVINVGTDTSELTNGVQILDPETAAVTKDAGNGTWAAALAADTVVGVSVTGTTASIAAGSGKAKVVLSFTKI